MSKSNRNIFIIAAIALLVIGSLCLAFAFGTFPTAPPSKNAVVLENTENTETKVDDTKLEENPIDFDAEKEKYPDMYAWIKISGTDIDYPVVQHPLDDEYYLTHNAAGDEDANGAIFTQMSNNKDFQDPVTVIYGHDMNLSGEMLNQLHLFEDEEFFNDNEYFEIYLPGKILRYRIISAYVADDRHIMNSFDFTSETTRKQYFESVCNPSSLTSNVREGAELDDDDKIVQISTCMSSVAMPDSRYLLTGELIETRLTK